MTSSQTAEKLIAAARKLFAESGYFGTSIDQIAIEAGLTKGAVYYLFKDKKDLFRAACVQVLRDMADQVTADLNAATPDTSRDIVTGGLLLLDAYQTVEARRLILMDGLAVLGVLDWTRIQDFIRTEMAERALNHAADAGLSPRELAPMLAHYLFGAFIQGVLQVAAASDPAKAHQEARDAYAYMATGLLSNTTISVPRSG